MNTSEDSTATAQDTLSTEFFSTADQDLVDGSEVGDTISIYGQYSIVYGYEGNDQIRIYGQDSKVYGGGDDDTLSTIYGKTYINGGNWDDVIRVDGSDGSIENISLSGGDGHDVFKFILNGDSSISADIMNFSDEDSIAVYSDFINGFNHTLENGTLILRDVDGLLNLTLNGIDDIEQISRASICIYTPDDEILIQSSTLKQVLAPNIDSVPDGMQINNSQTSLTVKTPFTGTIIADNFSGKLKKINASSDENPIEIIGNANNNVLKAGKGGATLDGGAGNDKIYGGKGVDTFILSEGKDVVCKYKSDDRIIIDKPIDSVKVSGKNVVFVVGDGTLTVKDVANKELTIVDADGETRSYVFTQENNTLDKALISTSDQELSAEAAMLASDGKNFINDCATNDSDTFLQECCGIILDNNDTGAITGFDAGNPVVKTAESIVPEYGSLKKLDDLFLNPSAASADVFNDVSFLFQRRVSFTKRGLSIVIDLNEDLVHDVTADLKRAIINGLYTWWIDSALNPKTVTSPLRSMASLRADGILKQPSTLPTMMIISSMSAME